MVFDGFYITQLYGRWIPFKCVSEREYLSNAGCLYVNALVSPLVKITDLYKDCMVDYSVPIGNYEKIFKIKECYI